MPDMPASQAEPASHLEAVDDAIPLSVVDAMQQLITEREELERFAAEKFAALDQLRLQLRADTDNAGQELQQRIESLHYERDAALTQVGALQRERDAALTRVDTLTKEVRRLKLGEQLASDELDQARQQAEQQRRHSAELQRLLDGLRAEIARQEQHYAQLAREHAELTEILQGFEQAEAELRQEQEAVRKDRERLQTAAPGQPALAARPNASTVVVGTDNHRYLNFTCKHCGTKLQAKEHLAGLVTRCSKCSKMSPVPKPGT